MLQRVGSNLAGGEFFGEASSSTGDRVGRRGVAVDRRLGEKFASALWVRRAGWIRGTVTVAREVAAPGKAALPVRSRPVAIGLGRVAGCTDLGVRRVCTQGTYEFFARCYKKSSGAYRTACLPPTVSAYEKRIIAPFLRDGGEWAVTAGEHGVGGQGHDLLEIVFVGIGVRDFASAH